MTTAAVEEKREGYGPTGKGGNGLILHSALAIEPEKGEVLGLLWQKLWNREVKEKPPTNETPEKKKKDRRNKAKLHVKDHLRTKNLTNG